MFLLAFGVSTLALSGDEAVTTLKADLDSVVKLDMQYIDAD